MSVQYTAIFHGCKNDNFQMKFFNIFLNFCSKHRLLVHVRTAVRRSNEYPQPMFWSKNKKKNVYPCKPQFYYIKVGCSLHGLVFVMKSFTGRVLDQNISCLYEYEDELFIFQYILIITLTLNSKIN